MDLRQLSYFVAVAEEGQFTRGAARVSVAQPAVSSQIRGLERELGEALFVRGPREVSLTEAGEALLPHARAALAAAQRGRDSITSLRGMLRGRLRVGVSKPIDRRLIEALGAFHRAHPAIEILLSEQHNEPLVRGVRDGEIDAAVIGMPGGALPPQITSRVIAVEPLVVAVRHGDPLSARKSVTLARLRDRQMVTLTHGSGLRSVLEAACRKAGFAPRISAETGELESLLELASQGLGVAILPRSAVVGPEVSILEITRPRLKRRTALIWNQANATPAGRSFLALAEEHLPSVSDR